MIVRLSTPSDVEQIRKLHRECFGDPWEYIDFYMQRKFPDCFCAVLEIDKEIVGMVHLLPCTVVPNKKAFYWYAAGIRSDFRNKGLFRSFTEHVIKHTRDAGYKNICVPAKGLERFYRSIGFSFSYTATDRIYKRIDIEKQSDYFLFENATADDFLQMQHEKGDVSWDHAALQYAIEENSYCNGKALKFYNDGRTLCFFALKKENSFLIDYHNLTQKDFEKIKSSLFDLLNCEQIVFRDCGTDQIVGLSDSELVKSDSKISMTLA